MKRSTCRSSLVQPALALLGLAILAPGIARAQTTYKVQPIVKFGDKVGDVTIKPDGDFEIGTLNDQGHIVFVTENSNPEGTEILVQYADGKLTLIAAAGREAPGGKWGIGYNSPVSMNQAGNIVFAAPVIQGDVTAHGTFLWDFKAQKITPVVLKSTPGPNGLVFEQAGGFSPKINNRGDIAFIATIKTAEGKLESGIFFVGQDGRIQPVAVPDQPLPGGSKLRGTQHPVLNEAGVIAFLGVRQGEELFNAFVWQNGTLTPLAMIGSDVPGGGKFASVTAVWVNNKNANVLVAARVDDAEKGADALYLYADGKITPVLVPGQELPGGGKYKNGQFAFAAYNVSFANDAGQHAILAALEDGSTAAYLMEPDGKLSLIMKSGTTTDLGKITNVGAMGTSFSIGLNNKGQVAINVKIDDGLDTMVLLTPQ